MSNTSPLTNLAAIGQFELLRTLYGQIAIAEGVWAELNAAGQAWPGSVEVQRASWITHHTVKNRNLVVALQKDLDLGEAESIALALELNSQILLIDETDGRHFAQRLGVDITGTVGILIAAKNAALISTLKPWLDALRQKAGFYLSNKLYATILDAVGEKEG